MGHELTIAVVCALGMLGVVAARPRSGNESTAARASSPRSHDDGVQDPGGRVRGPAAPAEETGSRVFVGAEFQVRDYVAAMIAYVGCNRLRDRVLVRDYRAWARDLSIVSLPDSIFLSLLAKHPNVRKSRDRLKDPNTGRVLKLASGTPQRGVFYTFSERPHAVVPRGVAMPDKKPSKRAESKARVQGRARRVHDLPERIAA